MTVRGSGRAARHKIHVLQSPSVTGRSRLAASRIERLCTQQADSVDVQGLDIRGYDIDGTLDLTGLSVPFSLQFTNCTFTNPLLLDGATLPSLTLRNCNLPGLLANGVRIHRDLDLSGSTVAGAHPTSASTSKRAAIWLCESDIGGRLLCVDTVIDAPGQRAIQADRMHVAGTVRLLHRFEAHGEIRFLGVTIDGSLDLTGAHLTDPLDGLALDLGDARIGGSLFLIASRDGRRPEIHGRINLGSAEVSGQLLCRDLTLRAQDTTVSGIGYASRRRGGTAISAPRLAIGSVLALEQDCYIAGAVDLSLAELSDVWLDGRTRLDAPGLRVLDLTNATISGNLIADPGLVARGTLRLSRARIRGRLTLAGTQWSDPYDDILIRADAVQVEGDVDLRRATARDGTVSLRLATIGGMLELSGAQLSNAAGWRTLSLRQATVRGAVRLTDGFRSTGQIMLNRMTVEADLDLRDGHFECPEPHPDNPTRTAIAGVAMTVRGGWNLAWRHAGPRVNFTRAATTALRDTATVWPNSYVVSGMTYDRYENAIDDTQSDAWDARARIDWLRGQETFDASAYEQAARVYQQHGYALEAERILIAARHDAHRAERARRHTMPWHRRPYRALRDAWNTLLRVLVGYGYRPARVLWILLILMILVAASLHLPSANAVMRAADPNGTVYTTHGPLRRPDPTPAGSTGPARHNPCGDGAVRCFNPEFYAVDTVIPLVSLGQRSTWYPDPHHPAGSLINWWLTLATLVGWFLSSVFVLSFTRLTRGTG